MRLQVTKARERCAVTVAIVGFSAFVGLHANVRAQNPAAEQTQQSTTYRACYVPEVGAMYLIGIAGLPESCLSTNHVEISWNEEGEAGQQGLQGDPGLNCWDLDGDGMQDDAEDITSDGEWNALDCQGEISPGSVITGMLADGAVTAAKIADGTVDSADLAVNSVGAEQLKDGAVGSSEIADNTVTADDLAPDAVTAAVRGSMTTILLEPSTTQQVTVPCGEGYHSMSGGWDVTAGPAEALRVTASVPTPTGWSFRMLNDHGTDNLTVQPFVWCIKLEM